MDPDRIRRAQHGDVAAFTELIEARIPTMVRTATAILGQEADARDAVQDALVSAWRALPRLREPSAFESWLTRILVHRCRRRRRQGQAASIREIPVDEASAADLPVVDDHARAERQRTLDRAFERLSIEHRTVLVLHHLDGRSVAEVAEILGIPAGTVKSRLFHARAALDRALRRES